MTLDTANHASQVQARDDMHRALLTSALHDGAAWIDMILANCPACRIASEACPEHMPLYERNTARGNLTICRFGFDGGLDGASSYGPEPLSPAERRTIAAALTDAIAYRRTGNAAEDLALIAAYCELERHLPASE